MTSFSNGNSRTALISGASQGLGMALAQFLAARGYDLIITGRNEARLADAVTVLAEQGGDVQGLAGDVADADHRRRLTAAVKSYGQLDLLVNNASTLGPLPMRSMAEYELDALRQVFEINMIAPLALVQATRPFLAASKGLVINISSDAAVGGYDGWGGYGSSKAALDLISLTLANELREEGISVVTVDPGDMRTTMHQDAFPGEDISDRPLPAVTMPFWAWLLGQERSAISGERFQAQSELWQVPA